MMTGYHLSNPVSPDSLGDSHDISDPTPAEPDLDTMMMNHLIDLIDKLGMFRHFFTILAYLTLMIWKSLLLVKS